MQTVFAPSKPGARAPMVFGRFSTVKQALRRNLNKVQSYYHERSLAVKNNHLLCRIINSIAINYTSDLQRFYDIVDARASSMAMAFKLSSDTYQGDIHDGVFYGEGTPEILVSDTSLIDPVACFGKWRYLEPVRILSHPKTDIEMHLPNGIAYSREQGLSVISIHIPMLLVMYRGFVHEQLEVLQRGGQAKTVAQFVNTYVLPNAVGSHFDLALINRCMALSLGQEVVGQTARKHPFALEDVRSQVDGILKDVNGILRRQTYSLEDMILSIPCLSAADATHALKLPPMSPTFQYAWVEVVARAHYLAWFMFLSPNNLKTYNKSLLQHVARLVAYDGIKSEIKKRLPASEADKTLGILSGIEEVAKA